MLLYLILKFYKNIRKKLYIYKSVESSLSLPQIPPDATICDIFFKFFSVPLALCVHMFITLATPLRRTNLGLHMHFCVISEEIQRPRADRIQVFRAQFYCFLSLNSISCIILQSNENSGLAQPSYNVVCRLVL